jgi:hypothetical protein
VQFHYYVVAKSPRPRGHTGIRAHTRWELSVSLDENGEINKSINAFQIKIKNRNLFAAV